MADEYGSTPVFKDGVTGGIVAGGFALWLINFQLIARTFFPWFLTVDQIWLGVVAHVFFFGTILGLYASSTKPSLPLPLGKRQKVSV